MNKKIALKLLFGIALLLVSVLLFIAFRQGILEYHTGTPGLSGSSIYVGLPFIIGIILTIEALQSWFLGRKK